MILDELRSQLAVALKAHETVKVETIRFLLAAVRNLAISKYDAAGESKLTDEDILDVIKKQVKTHNESIEAFTKAGMTELAANEKAQLAILHSYLPKQISDEELKKLLEQVIAEGGDFGPMMGKAMKVVAGKADGSRVSALLKILTK